MTSANIVTRLPEIRDQLYEEIAQCFDDARGRILDIKNDDYILSHDIDVILDQSNPFEAHLDRFRFVLFIGYDSTLLTDPETMGHEDHLERETIALFEAFVDDLKHDSTFGALTIDVFIYPAPSLEMLTQLVDKKVREAV